MDELIKNLGSGSWWIGVVVVSLLVNLLSAYIKPPIDGVALKGWKWFRLRGEKRRRRFEAYVATLKSSDENLRHAYFVEGRFRNVALLFLLLTAFLLMAALAMRPSATAPAEFVKWLRLLIMAGALVGLAQSMAASAQAQRIALAIQHARRQVHGEPSK